MVKFKFNRLPNKHVVDRYFEAVSVLNVKNDGTYDNFQIAKLNQVDVSAELNLIPSQYITVAIGAQYATKRMPVEMMVALFEKIKQSLKPGGVVVIQGYGKNQLSYNTGGPGKLDHLYDEDLLRQAFEGYDIQVCETYETIIHEGAGHSGMSALVGLVARKP